MISPALLLVLSMAVLLVSIALVRELRLRKALQRLLAQFLKYWRKMNANDPPADDSHAAAADDARL